MVNYSKIMGKINHEIWQYRTKYGKTPQLIIISRELELLLSRQLNLMSLSQVIILNDKDLQIYTIFGINCLVSPALKDFDFEVR